MTGVLLVYLDDARADALSYMPWCASRAATGTRFTNAYSSVPVCGPARTALYTGQRPQDSGVLENGQPATAWGTTIHDVDLLGANVRRAGWRTGHVGKFASITWQIPGDPDVGGWDHLAIWTGATWLNPWAAEVWDGSSTSTVYAWHTTRQATEIATGVIEPAASNDQPWFAVWATSSPHWPFSGDPRSPFAWAGHPPDPRPAQDGTDWPSWVTDRPEINNWHEVWRTKIAQARELLDVDQHLQAMAEHGLLDDVTVIISSDNGRHAGDHRMEGAGSKNTLYDPAARVPLVAWGPGFDGRGDIDVPACTQDLTATILAIAEATPVLPHQIGVDLRTIARSPHAWANRAVLVQVGPNELTPGSDAVITRTDKLMHHPHATDPGEEWEGYQLDIDPGELVNVAGDPAWADTRGDLEARLAQLTTLT